MRVIHHGATKFNKELFNDIKTNRTNKPSGGLWTSPIDSNRSWYDWCERSDFSTGDNSLSFELEVGGKILEINSVNDFEDKYLVKTFMDHGLIDTIHIDFELIAKDYDCIYVTEKAIDETFGKYFELNLYGWDCETVLILNKDCIND